METNIKEALVKVFTEVVEKLAFMFVEEVSSESVSAQEALYAEMTFSGELNGVLSMMVPEKRSIEIAANILGVDAEDEFVEEKTEDAIKELLNVTCGQLLTELAGETPVFTLSVPVAEKRDASGWNDFIKRGDTICLMADDIPVLLNLELGDA